MINTIETKVIAAAAGSGVGAALSAFVLWLLGVNVWHVSAAADHAGAAVAAVPTPVSGVIVIALTVIGSAVSGYIAPHTSRTEAVTPTPADTPVAPLELPEPDGTVHVATVDPTDPSVLPSPNGAAA